MTQSQTAAGGGRHFHDQLAALQDRLLAMASHAEELVDRAMAALRARERALASAVVEDDAVLDALELEIEQRAIALLALQQPLARDLRFIIGTIKVSSDLERVGDHAVNIAEATLRLLEIDTPLDPRPELAELARRAGAMLDDALDAFVKGDGALGRDVCRRDDEVDAMLEGLFRVLLTHMIERPASISAALQLLLVGRNLERVADLATNIGEDAVYLAEGSRSSTIMATTRSRHTRRSLVRRSAHLPEPSTVYCSSWPGTFDCCEAHSFRRHRHGRRGRAA